jgi:hypothetical protein
VVNSHFDEHAYENTGLKNEEEGRESWIPSFKFFAVYGKSFWNKVILIAIAKKLATKIFAIKGIFVKKNRNKKFPGKKIVLAVHIQISISTLVPQTLPASKISCISKVISRLNCSLNSRR